MITVRERKRTPGADDDKAASFSSSAVKSEALECPLLSLIYVVIAVAWRVLETPFKIKLKI
jgi:hypothetical protein